MGSEKGIRDRCGVFQPIWAPVWDTTLTRAAAAGDGAPVASARVVAARVVAARFAEPRLEPEIAVGLRDTPADDTPEAVPAATAWIAHAVELAQRPFCTLIPSRKHCSPKVIPILLAC